MTNQVNDQVNVTTNKLTLVYHAPYFLEPASRNRRILTVYVHVRVIDSAVKTVA